jgi:hypothetical protein
MRFKRLRLGPQILRQAANPQFFTQTHVIFGGTGAVGGATALQMIALFEEAGRRSPLANRREPRIVITGRSKQELRQFTHLLFSVQRRDHGHFPTSLEGIGYLTGGGVVVELTTFSVDPSIPGLEDFSQRDDAGRLQAVEAFLEAGGLAGSRSTAEKSRYLKEIVTSQVGRPFTQFLSRYREERGFPSRDTRFRSVVIGIPLASLAAYKLTDLEEASQWLGVDRGTHEMEDLKDHYLRAIRDDLAFVATHLADEVMAAHTTAVGGMYDEQDDGTRVIRLGFAHSALDTKLRDKQMFAEKLARLFAERGIKMLITAAAIGVDAVLPRKSPPLNATIRRNLIHEAANGNHVVPSADLGSGMHVYPPVEVDLLREEHVPLCFEHGRPLVLDYVLRSGENGYFTVSNTDALYRVMRVTSGSELGLLLARTCLLGDDPQSPAFSGNACYYTENDNSRQVFDLLGQPQLRASQISGLQPKALQDLGSAKHQAELHTLGLVILRHRLKSLDLEALPAHVDLSAFNAQEYFESNSAVLTLDCVMSWQVESLATDLVRLATAHTEVDLAPLKSFVQADPGRQEAAHRILHAVLAAAWAVSSIGTPIVYEAKGRRRVISGYYAAAIDRVVTHRDRFASHLACRFAEVGGGGEATFERFVEFHIANNGFVDLRPLAVLVSARSDVEDLTGKVQVFRNEEDFIAAVAELEPYSYFTSSGLLALLVRLKGLCRMAHELNLEIGTANEFRTMIPHDDQGNPLLVPGVVEAFRMVSEGLEKNTGSEWLDGRWGYYA